MNDVVLGVSHITDWQGYDHMLYLLALVARFDLRHVGRAALLATAFTVGHSLTLAIASLDLFRLSSAWVEFFDSSDNPRDCIVGTFSRRGQSQGEEKDLRIGGAFGLIHGMGFSSFFRISRDETVELVAGLFRFNLGVEIGQLIIVLVLLACGSVLRVFNVSEREQQVFVCGGATFLSLVMALERWPF